MRFLNDSAKRLNPGLTAVLISRSDRSKRLSTIHWWTRCSVSLVCVGLALCLLQGCGKNVKKEPWDVGEVVTWRISDDLVVKGKLGTRRRHIPLSPQGEAALYVPTEWRYMGQFPIDYVPERYPLITAEEARRAMEPGRPLEFDLMLNGSWVVPTDAPYSPQAASSAIDHPDQVRVQYDGKADGYIESITTFRYAGNAISEEHSFEKIGLTCKIFEDRYDGKLGSFNPTHCYHASEDLEKRVAAFSIYNGLREMRVIFFRTRQGRTERVTIDMSKANIAQWKLIETKVWDLIDRWNVIS